MTVQLADDGTILLVGHCPAEDADVLLQLKLATPGAAVDWRACRSAHTAVIQVLLAAGCEPVGPSPSEFLERMMAPALARSRAGTGIETMPFSRPGRDAK